MNTKSQSNQHRSKLHILTLVTPMLLAGLAAVATLDTAAASSRSGNRTAAPRAASATNQSFSHIDAVNQNKASPGVKTDKLCPGYHCHFTHGDH